LPSIRLPNRRRLLAAGALAATGLLVAACSSGSSSSSGGTTSATSVTTVRVGVIAGSPPGLLASLQNGTFAKEGIKIDLVTLSGGPAIVAAVASGSVDIGWADMFAWSSAIERGFNLTIVNPANGGGSANSKDDVLVTGPHSGITSAADLTGKSIGVPAQALTTVQIKQWLTGQGLNPNGPKYVTVNDRTTEGGLVAEGQIQVAATSGASVTEWEAEYGLKVIADYDGGVPSGAATSGYGTLKSYAESHQALIEKFAEVVRAGVASYQTAAPAQQNAITAAYGGANVASLEKKYPGALAAAAKSSDTELRGPFNVTAENDWLSLGVKFGALTKPINISKYLWPTATEALPALTSASS
jgi:ABC-type nitrate/sulfonate/bicarbonate transport system substrate-binding protein